MTFDHFFLGADSLLRKEGLLPSSSFVAFGWHQKSVGFHAPGGRWVRLSVWSAKTRSSHLATGIETSTDIRGVKKPRLINSIWSQGSDESWLNVAVLTASRGAAFDSAPRLSNLSAEFWATLTESLEVLQEHLTGRVSLRQEYLSRRLQEFAGIAQDLTIVTAWTTAHGDLHWSNLTDQAEILDWEGWGLAPAGFDVAMLWSFSLQDEQLADAVLERLPHPCGWQFRLVQLIACAEIVAQNDRYGDYPELAPLASEELRRGHAEAKRGDYELAA